MATYLVTGANRGIGLEYCKQLKNRGDDVIGTCRSCEKELFDLGVRVESDVDITSGESVLRLIKTLKGVKIDVLIQNAGILEANSFSNFDPESITRQFEVNALSPLCFTRAIINNLSCGSKVILMSSRMGSISDNSSGGSYGYRMSKVALCMAGKSLAIDLIPQGIAVALLHPGLVSTRMTGFTQQGITPKQSVEGLLERIDSLSLENTGLFWHANGEILPW
ncbi:MULTISPECIES: SDR family oxidoreductase [Prochlorococcus]|uniref:Short-chain dehydrogenase/reductase family enzyme n=1 Tax=Prochlorococcus marinus (strain SARG / CCMP1375 / SS120) TaxID=167539 RepID=Q7VCN0_PROMA|nr:MULTISPECIES: SDR family oxidoreductase [Prochlorococcus]AAP99754.1 Short-chain dehydrogenase/reductase family enzyme [Prochlorococcus marinus subsp. marinus str. CCMP1375]KGG14464.1 Short-chain dehydrogenase/reductase (SDR) [Prochlorococcus marinus str. LG]KGG22546.1 Short-chain dehydrogenase/reductase (SDR) [Prochlorococcus marinus str. SS2]KGG24389.1 Short-chain dehydrogenase/reductase (SDR) [Prochlorococcus marinus str. SS35]KGG34161.1 Short-chain dehydrogenase/reductase (SDR) [Prochlor